MTETKATTDLPTDAGEHLEELTTEYKAIRAKMDRLRTRCHTLHAHHRCAMGQINNLYNRRLEMLTVRVDEISRKVLDLWESDLPGVAKIQLPRFFVAKRTDISLKVKNVRAVIDALDRLDRLDLVEQTIAERGLRKLVREGHLRDLGPKVLQIIEEPKIQVTKRRGK